MMYQLVLGVIAPLIGTMGYVLYLRDIFKGTTKPHVFSWFLWGVIAAIAYFAQTSAGAGPGAWIMAFTALVCFAMTVLALFYGEKKIVLFDWACLVLALLGLVLWQTTQQALLAVIAVSLVEVLAFAPTYRKSFFRPQEETVTMYMLSTLQYFTSLLAISSYNATTILYPVTLVIINGAFVVMLMIRRKQLAKI